MGPSRPAPGCAFQPADTPERLEKFLARLRAYPEVHGRKPRGAARGDGERPDRRPRRRRADHRPARGDRRDADRAGPIVPSLVRVARGGSGASARWSGTWSTPPTPPSSRRSAASIWRPPGRSPASPRRPTASDLYRMRIRHQTTLDLDPAGLHQFGLDELESIEEERREIARPPGFGDDTGDYRAHAGGRSGQPARDRGRWSRGRGPDRRAMAVAPRYFGRLPAALCEVRPVEAYKEKDARSPTTTRRPRTARGPGRTTSTRYDLPSPARSPSSRRRRSTRQCPATISRSRSRWRTRPEHLPALARADGGRRLRRGLGALLRAPG